MIYDMLISIALFIAGFIIGLYAYKAYLYAHISDGVCLRTDDGEVYLRLSEIAQEKLADPMTELLVLKVIDAHTRNEQPL